METNEQQIQILRANLLPLLQPKSSSSSSSPTTSEYLLPGSSIHSNQLIIQSYGGQTLYMIDHVYIYKIQLSSPLSSSTYEFMPTKNPMIPFPFHCPSMIQSMECVFTHPDYSNTSNTTNSTHTDGGSRTIRWSHIQHDQVHDRMACVDENGQLFLFEFTNNSHQHHHHDHNNNNTVNENDDDGDKHEKHDDEEQDNHKRTKRQRNENRIHPTLIYNINSSPSSSSSTTTTTSTTGTTTTNQHANHGELGWCNVSFDAIDPNLIYIARHWYRDVIVLNVVKSTPTIVHVIHTSQRPTAIHAFPIQNTVNQKNNGSVASSLSSSYLAVAETNVVMIYHIGQSSSSSSCDNSSIVIKCVTSVAKCRGTIYSITSDYKAHQQTKKHAHCLAVTGSDRTIYLFDTKKWAPRAKWQNAIKYSPSWIQMSSPSNSSAVDSASLIYVAGIDNSELKCGQSILNQSINKRSIGNNSNSIYADSRWLGLAHYQSPTSGQEMIVGLSQSGGLYVILNPNLSAIAAQ